MGVSKAGVVEALAVGEEAIKLTKGDRGIGEEALGGYQGTHSASCVFCLKGDFA